MLWALVGQGSRRQQTQKATEPRWMTKTAATVLLGGDEGRTRVSEVALADQETTADFASGPRDLMVLDWEQVKGAAQAAFNVWVDGGELQWAKEVWDRTVAAGFANYSNEIERHRAAVLFFGLAGLYRDFCSLAWEERDAPTYSYWAEQLNLDDFVLGQLVGPDPGIKKKDALNHVVNAARPQVMTLLTQIFVNVDSLFVALWRAGPDSANEEDDDCDEDELLTDAEILNDATPEKLAAYSWLDSGADVVLDPF